jgi:ACR3 family arsenite efflux pump ArsB
MRDSIMQRESLERYQVVVYLAAILAGGIAGLRWPSLAGHLELLVWPLLAFLLYSTFCQVSFSETMQAFRSR